MYLQLAENEMDTNYIPLETNQGTIFVRRDLAENVTLSAGGKGLQVASKIVGKVAPNIPIPGAAKVGQIASKVLQKAGDIQAKSGIEPGKLKIGQKLKASIDRLKAKGASPAVTAIPEAVSTEKVVPEEKVSFFQKYRTPLLIGGGVLVLGTAAYLLTRKKKR